jgi:hypothetical protein
MFDPLLDQEVYADFHKKLSEKRKTAVFADLLPPLQCAIAVFFDLLPTAFAVCNRSLF